MADHNLSGKTVRSNDSWTFYCDECDLPYMQSFDFHNEEYHNGRLTK